MKYVEYMYEAAMAFVCLYGFTQPSSFVWFEVLELSSKRTDTLLSILRLFWGIEESLVGID
jgi:hypothetical protein